MKKKSVFCSTFLPKDYVLVKLEIIANCCFFLTHDVTENRVIKVELEKLSSNSMTNCVSV